MWGFFKLPLKRLLSFFVIILFLLNLFFFTEFYRHVSSTIDNLISNFSYLVYSPLELQLSSLECIESTYLMSLLNTTLQTLIVRVRDMNGIITQQKLHTRIFDAYEAKALVFEAITPQQQIAMQQYNGVIPPFHPAGQPIVLDSWAELLKIHNDANLYQVLPRRAKTNEAYAVLRAITSSAASPFTMDDRVDPIEYKFAFKPADVEFRNQFNANNPDKITSNVWFDGILKAKTASALVSCYNTASIAQINNLAGTEQFLRHWAKQPVDSDRHRQLKEMYTELFTKPTLLFFGIVSVPGRDILNHAKSKNVFVYAKKGMQYFYHP